MIDNRCKFCNKQLHQSVLGYGTYLSCLPCKKYTLHFNFNRFITEFMKFFHNRKSIHIGNYQKFCEIYYKGKTLKINDVSIHQKDKLLTYLLFL